MTSHPMRLRDSHPCPRPRPVPRRWRRAAPAVLALGIAHAAIAQTVVFSHDFDSALPPQVAPGVAMLEGVQGYAGLGQAGNQFGGTFLRSPTGNRVTVTLTGLPSHRAIHVAFLFAAIDSLDGTGTYPAGDFFKITLDGVTVFRESFANALPTQFQSYVPPPGVELARRVDLGFGGPGGYFTDSAYDLGADPLFFNLLHTAPSARFTFEIEGPGIQPLDDESWAMDNLRISVATTPTGSVAAYGASCGPVLDAGGPPAIGRALRLTQQGLPPSTTSASCALGLSSTRLGQLPLPFPMDLFGMPGCWLLHDFGLVSGLAMAQSGSTATLDIPVPNDPTFVSAQFFAQGYAAAPGTNAVGLVMSGGLRLVIGP